MKRIFLVMLIAVSNSVIAQDIFQDKFYTPELVLKYREEAGLSEQQIETVKKIYNEEIPAYNTTKWDMDAEMARLEKLISENKVDSKAATAQLEKVLKLEVAIKKMKLEMLVKVKNTLTPEQQTKLNPYRDEAVSSTRMRMGLGGKQSVSLLGGRGMLSEKPLFHVINGTEEKMLNELPSDIKPEDIESLHILRGEAVKEKYGERGANGVVVITLKTKK